MLNRPVYRSVRNRALFGLLVFAATWLLLAGIAFAEDETKTPVQPGESRQQGTETTVASPGVAANGMVIGWDPVARVFLQPTPAAAAEILARFHDQILASPETFAPLALPRELQIEELPNGMTRARLPVHLINTSFVRIGPDGQLHVGHTRGLTPSVEPAQSVARSKEEIQ